MKVGHMQDQSNMLDKPRSSKVGSCDFPRAPGGDEGLQKWGPRAGVSSGRLTLASPGLLSRTPLSDCREWTMHCSNWQGCRGEKATSAFDEDTDQTGRNGVPDGSRTQFPQTPGQTGTLNSLRKCV